MGWNLTGLKTLFMKEVRRFSTVWKQTVLSPLITTSLYFLVFGVALGSRLKTIDGVPYIEFVVPGLIMLSMITNAFLNTASSLFQSKINGTLLDVLIAPLGATEVVLAYVGAAMLRAFVVGGLVFLVAVAFTGFHMAHPGWALLFAVAVSASFALLGILAAMWAEKYDHLSIVPNFVLTPLTFLGGVFYSIDMLPAPWDTVSRLNPVLYMVNGLRYGLLGSSDVDVLWSAATLCALLAVLAATTWYAVHTGYNIRD
ncbi:MAG: ABC transporter [Myxococcales bacterium]|nr:ABC transporter [Myxococcales bacterium]